MTPAYFSKYSLMLEQAFRAFILNPDDAGAGRGGMIDVVLYDEDETADE